MRLADTRCSLATRGERRSLFKRTRLFDANDNVIGTCPLVPGALACRIERRTRLTGDHVVQIGYWLEVVLVPTNPTCEFLPPYERKPNNFPAARVAAVAGFADPTLLKVPAGTTFAFCHRYPSFRQRHPPCECITLIDEKHAHSRTTRQYVQ